MSALWLFNDYLQQNWQRGWSVCARFGSCSSVSRSTVIGWFFNNFAFREMCSGHLSNFFVLIQGCFNPLAIAVNSLIWWIFVSVFTTSFIDEASAFRTEFFCYVSYNRKIFDCTNAEIFTLYAKVGLWASILRPAELLGSLNLGIYRAYKSWQILRPLFSLNTVCRYHQQDAKGWGSNNL